MKKEPPQLLFRKSYLFLFYGRRTQKQRLCFRCGKCQRLLYFNLGILTGVRRMLVQRLTSKSCIAYCHKHRKRRRHYYGFLLHTFPLSLFLELTFYPFCSFYYREQMCQSFDENLKNF